MAKETMAWHFVQDDGVLRETGKKIVHTGELALGFHASIRAIDALQYVPGPLVCRVVVGGETRHNTYKLVARERTTIWSYDATEILRLFARQCALEVIDLWNPPDAVRDCLTGDDHLSLDAMDAARDAARDVASDETRADAARAARAASAAVEAATSGEAWEEARAAAADAAWATGWEAVSDAAGAHAAWEEARAAQNALLESLLVAGAQDCGFEL